MKKTSKNYIMAIILGIAVGCLTLVGQKYLPANLNFLANSGAVWLIPAFCVSYYSKSNKMNSIILCIVCLLFCVSGYYTFEAIMNHHGLSINTWEIVWTVMAFVAGFVFGFGAYFANNNENFLKYCGMNLLPAVFFSEGINKLIHISDYSHMVPAVIMVTLIGLILYIIINRKDIIKKNNIISFAALSVLGLAGFEVLYRISA
ncbi:MAG: hypothetical protein K2J41_03545 [Eubacterium sp.]|nr:hypothetical protein [Eubacterium sp.]